MLKRAAIISIGLAMGISQPALADDHVTATGWEIVERNDRGQATKVRKDGETVDVCMNEQQTDGCINPYAAGLEWGDRPLDYWPGSDNRE